MLPIQLETAVCLARLTKTIERKHELSSLCCFTSVQTKIFTVPHNVFCHAVYLNASSVDDFSIACCIECKYCLKFLPTNNKIAFLLRCVFFLFSANELIILSIHLVFN